MTVQHLVTSALFWKHNKAGQQGTARLPNMVCIPQNKNKKIEEIRQQRNRVVPAITGTFESHTRA